MHELSLMESMLELAEDAARQEGARGIEAIHLDIGALAGVVPEALEFAFAGLKEGTLAEQAALKVRYLPAVAHCEPCGLEFELDNDFGVALCPACETPTATLRQGRELRLSHLEVV